MQFNFFKWKVIVYERDNLLPFSRWNRRRLATKVDNGFPDVKCTGDLKIDRIKAARFLRNCKLVDAKEWVECAYKENGYGVIA